MWFLLTLLKEMPMKMRSWLGTIFARPVARLTTRTPSAASKRTPRCRLGMEVLEDRTVPAVLTFEGQAGFVSGLTTYGGLIWTGFNALNNSPTLNGLHGGYNTGAVSGTTVAYNGPGVDSGQPSDITLPMPFTFNSAYLTAAYNNGLNVVVEGWSAGDLLYTTSLTLGPDAATFHEFDYIGIDDLRFYSSGGSRSPNVTYGGSGDYVVVDDFAYTPAATAVTPSVSLTTVNAAYTGAAFDTANLTTVVTPAAAAGSVLYVFYSDAAGQNAIATPVNAGAYFVQAFFTSSSSDDTDGKSGIVSFTIAKADASFNVMPYSGTYDGFAHNITAVATGVGSDGDLSSLVTVGLSQTNAGSYTGTWSFSGNDNYNPANGAAAITITAKSLTVDAATQGTLNIAKAGTISISLQITAGLVASNNDVAALFNGAVFTIVVDGTSYSLASTATVTDGTINVSMQMSQGLQNALLTALSEGKTVDFSLSALSNDLDYSIDADAISRLISQGKLKYAVV
jgi:hypothetical protein